MLFLWLPNQLRHKFCAFGPLILRSWTNSMHHDPWNYWLSLSWVIAWFVGTCTISPLLNFHHAAMSQETLLCGDTWDKWILSNSSRAASVFNPINVWPLTCTSIWNHLLVCFHTTRADTIMWYSVCWWWYRHGTPVCLLCLTFLQFKSLIGS